MIIFLLCFYLHELIDNQYRNERELYITDLMNRISSYGEELTKKQELEVRTAIIKIDWSQVRKLFETPELKLVNENASFRGGE